MKVEITLNDAKRGVELLFNEGTSKELSNRLKEFGFKQGFRQPLKWYAPQHPAFVTYAGELKEALLKGRHFASVHIRPSFLPSEENIDHNKFSYVTISYNKGGNKEQDSFVVFDSYKTVATAIANHYAKQTYGDAFKEIDVSPRNYKRKARTLLKEGKVITDTIHSFSEVISENLEPENTEPLANENGVYTKELAGSNMEELIIPFPKAAKFEASVRIVQGTDGLYRYGISIDSNWEGVGGVSFAPSINSQTFQDRQQTLKAALDYIAGNTLNNDSAYKAIEKFAIENGVQLYKTEESTEPESSPGTKKHSQEHFTGSNFEIIEESREVSPLYHGTCLPFERFEKQFLGTKTGDIPSHLGYHFTPNKKLAATLFANDPHNESYEDCRYIEVGLKVNKTLKTTEEALVKKALHWAIKHDIITKRVDELLELLKLPYDADEKKEKSLVRTLNSDEWYNAGNPVVNYEIIAIRFLNEVLREQGFDSILYRNAIEWPDENRYDWIVFDESQIIYRNQKYVGKTQAEVPQRRSRKNHRKQLIDLGFDDMFTAQEALDKPYKVADLQSRWYDTYQYYTEQHEKPAREQIQRWETVLEALKGQKDKTSKEQRSTLKQKITNKTSEVATIKTLVENENISFQQEMINQVIERAIALGYTLDNEETKTNFSVDISEGLFDERIIEPYYKRSIPEVVDEIIMVFFKEQTTTEQQTRINGVEKNLTDHPIKDMDDVWTMTPLEYQQMKAIEKTGSSMVLDAKDRHNHEAIVKQAIEDGENVPQRVLDHYPWLVEESPTSSNGKYDYLDRVIAHMHEKYANGERPTKGQIEKIAKELGVPNMGMMWEATELSWLLWYKNIYNQQIPFEDRLAKMIHFWNKLQPTYAYSDSSKEIYKQYSTPCPIGAIVAQYTGMDAASKIFEPSAGNGLLLVGADPRKTHVNEIDQTRLASLKFQGFNKITALNATDPFPNEMAKSYDVVVTNPPFARWEDEKFDKELIIRKYFNNHVGLAKHIRLEHLMAGLALYSMKNTGKAAIIIMGHVYFGKDGFIAKYRPFFNWLFRHYQVDDVINMNSFKLYNKQGAIEKTMLILVGGRKAKPGGVAPTQKEAAHLYDMVNSFSELWERVKGHMWYDLEKIIQQLEIALAA